MAKIKTLYVQVSGLCMIVQTSDRLFVLMPKVMHAGHTHCPFLMVPPAFSDGAGIMENLQGKHVELGALSTKGSVMPLTNLALDASSVTNKSPVRDECLGTTLPNSLSARIALPLPTELEPLGKTARLKVIIPRGRTSKVRSHGRIGLSFDVSEMNMDELTIGGTGLPPLKPEQSGDSVEFTLVNIRPKDWGREPEDLAADEHLMHLDAYFGLLNLNIPNPPSVHALAAVKGLPKRPGDDICGSLPYDDEFPRWSGIPDGQVSTLGIDPYACTVGGGCPNGQC